MVNSRSTRTAAQLRIGKAALDFAEFTGWRWWIFGELNDVRKEQRKELEDYRSLHAIPAGVEIRADKLSLAETISPDKFRALRESLLSALPSLPDQQSDFERSYREIVAGSLRGGSMQLGYIVRPGERAPFGGVSSISEKLPRGVKFVRLEIRKLLPSFAVLYVDASFDDSVTAQMLALLGCPSLPAFRITQLRFGRRAGLGWRQTGISTRREVALLFNRYAEAIAAVVGIDRLRDTAGRRVATYNRPIVTYSFTGAPTVEEMKSWINDNGQWLDGVGIEMIPFSLYGNGKAVFAWTMDTWRTDVPLPHHILVFRNLCGNEVTRAAHKALRSVAAAVGLFDWLQTSIRVIEDLRDEAFRTIQVPRRLTTRTFAKYARIIQDVRLRALLADRILEEAQTELKAALTEIGGTRFSLLDPSIKFIPADFAEAIRMNITRSVPMLRSQTADVNRAFSEFISIRNMEATYRLQRTVVVLTIITALVTLLAAIPALSWMRSHWPF